MRQFSLPTKLLLLSTAVVIGIMFNLTGFMTLPTSAQQWTPGPNLQGLYEPDDITCTNAYNYIDEPSLTAKERKQTQYQACREGYNNQDNPSYCTDKNYSSTAQTDACEAGMARHGDPGIKFCAARHAMGTSADPKNTKFHACYDGFKNGEGACNIHHPATDTDKKPLREACLEGVRGGVYTQGAAASADAEADLSQNPDTLGKDPKDANISNLVAGEKEIATRAKCSIEGFFGGMMCDFLSLAGNVADASLALLGSFMKVDALTTNQDDPIYNYWKIFRTVANVIFIIAFLVIIISQMSGLGLSAYGVKKMVPRLVVGAILINVSYFACAAAVDVSNIVGSTVYGTMKNAIAPPPNPDSPTQESDRLQVEMRPTTLINPEDNSEISMSYLVSAMAFTGAVSAVASTGLILNGGLAALIPIVISVALTVVVVVICLLLRQALIIIFIIIAPLAFASFLLPNTKTLFDRWLKSFIPLLMLFPAIAFMFGIGAIVSEIMLAAAFAKPDFLARSLFMLVALAVQVLPLLVVPKLMAIGGGLLAQLANISQGKTGGLNNKAKEYAQKQKALGDRKAAVDPKWYNKHRAMRADHEVKNRIADQTLTQAQQMQTPAYAQAEAGPQPTSSPSDTSPNETPPSSPPSHDTSSQTAAEEPAETVDTATTETTANETSPENTPATESETETEADTYDEATAKEIHIAVKAKAARVKARSAQFDTEHAERNDVLAIATLKNATATNTDIEGAIMNLASVGDVGAILEMMKVSDRMSPSQRQTLIKSAQSSGAGAAAAPMLANPEVQENIQNGKVNEHTIGSAFIAPSLRTDDFSPESMAKLDQDIAREVVTVLRNPQANDLTDTHVNDIITATDTALRTDSTSRRITKQRDSLVEIQALRRPR